MFKLDDLLKELGEFGPYQRRVFAITCTIVFFSSWLSMIPVFLAATVDHWCETPEWTPGCEQYGLSEEACALAQKEGSIPSNYTSDGELEYAQCEKYNVSGEEFWPGIDPSNYSSGSLPVIECDQGWAYDTSQYKSSIVTDFDLVCGKEDLTQVSQSLYFGGYLLGSVVFGSLADVIGRWWSLMICMIIRLIAGFALAFSPSWWVFSTIRFIQGFVAIPIYIISFVLANEFAGTSKRNITGILFAVPFATGYVCLALVAYFIRYWKTLEIVATVPTLVLMAIMMFLPESVRWQISSGRYDKAEKTLATMAKSNKKTLPSPLFTEQFKEQRKSEGAGHQASALDLFRTPKMRMRSINLTFNWMVNAVVYHGLSLNTSNLGVNDYLAFAIAGAVEIPAYLFSSVLVEVIGRPRCLCGLLLLSGASLLSSAIFPPGTALTVFAMIGKFGISAAYAVLFLYTVELYPTSIRSSAMGLFSTFSRVAGIISPLILTLSKYWRPLPMVIYGAAGVAVGFSTLLLPETRGRKLPDTLEEGENFGMKSLKEEKVNVTSKTRSVQINCSEEEKGVAV
ncbi:organic cation transporter protein-like [Strongylocentrotus purpuratus]|uniref:Major facilitator superfamily (MFS) profile domain-containing protein n=1 Tax=Strongylocentrotus purpuratus TaxID=7668 RepID=A0A7M7SSR0_STRPU|nr:organic cation transporter protein-like [Strongylocentrotus purpuratus]